MQSGLPQALESPKGLKSKPRALDSRKSQPRAVKEPSLRPVRVLALPKRVTEAVKARYEFITPKAGVGLRVRLPYRSQEGKSPSVKDRRSLTPGERLAVR